MQRLSYGLILVTAAVFGCTRPHYPSDPFSGPTVTGGPSAAPAAGAPTLPQGPGDTYAPNPVVRPGAGLQSSYTAPAEQQSTVEEQSQQPLAATPPAEEQQPQWTDSVDEAQLQPVDDSPIAPISFQDDAPPPGADEASVVAEGDGPFRGRDPEYRWISGTLEYVAMDRKWQVRYAPYSVEDDRFGGSLLLEDDPRLKGFQRGDIVHVEGELVRQPTRMVPDNAIYRIKQIQKLD